MKPDVSRSSEHKAPQGNLALTAAPEGVPRMITLVALLAVVFAWRIVFSGWVNLVPDECSYWTWSRRLDWSYFDNSGMVAYLIRLSTWLFGHHSPFSVRFPFLVLSGASTYLVYRVAAILFEDKSRALLAAVVFNLTPVALIGGSAAIHDNVLIFTWILALWAAANFLKGRDPRWFYVLGAAAGLAIQSKYTGVLLLPCLLLFFLWSGRYRGWLWAREPWIGVLVAAALSLPIVYWNIRHDWASLHHILYIGSGAPSISRRILDGLGYHAAQFLLISPLIYVALIAGAFSALRRNVITPDPRAALLLCFGLPLALFGVMAFKGHVEANWAFMGYVSTLILAVEMVVGRGTQDPGDRLRFAGKRFYRWALILAVAPVLVVALHGWLGLIPAGLERRIVKEDRIVWETLGWDGLGTYLGSLLQDSDTLAADSYQLCATLEFNVPGNPRVRYLAPWKRPTQFDVWEPSFDDLAGMNILFISPIPLEPTGPVRGSIYENFSRVEALPSYKFLYHGVPIREMYIYRCYDFNPYCPRRLGPRSLFYRE